MYRAGKTCAKGKTVEPDYKKMVTTDPSEFVVLADYVPSIVQEIRYYSTYNFVGDRSTATRSRSRSSPWRRRAP